MLTEADINAPACVVVTCEHAGHEVPDAYAHLFAQAGDVLESHRGYDPGAIGVAVRLSALLSAPLLHTHITRLLIEANRSIGHPDLFSPFTHSLPEQERHEIIERYYLPHRTAVDRTIGALIATGSRVVHLGVHTFTDTWPGKDRAFEIGLLFDPTRAWEHTMCQRWAERIADARPGVRVRLNEPYLGTDDGLTTWLRTRYGPEDYAGIEIELRQGAVLTQGHQPWADLLSGCLTAPVIG